MMMATADNWQEANQRYLMARVAGVRKALKQHIARVQNQLPEEDDSRAVESALDDATRQLPYAAALDSLCAAFFLSSFERDILLLCAGMELDSGLAPLCAAAQGNSHSPFPTFSLALAALPEAHWSALTPGGPLRRWRLLEVGVGDTLTTSPLRIDERVLHYLTGVSSLEARLQGFVESLPAPGDLPPSQRRQAQWVTDFWSRTQEVSGWPIIHLGGGEKSGKRAIAAFACAALGLQAYVLNGEDIPLAVLEREALARLWEREAALTRSALLIEYDDQVNSHSLVSFMENLQGMLMVASREPLRLRKRLVVNLEVTRPNKGEQQSLWQEVLGPLASRLDGELERVVAQFNLSAQKICAAGAHLRSSLSGEEGEALGPLLWEACRSQARARLEDLAQRIDPAATWDDLILPEPQMQTLRDIATHVRQRAKVYETWGFAAKGARGLGISALFAGASGTGKTMAAEVLAGALRLDLYRIDLSQVVNKYIGETEKNLRRVFDAAETGGAILLFDEADALFGKRSEVKDSHDRYANIEVSYLLQRMETYRGLSILTTNMKTALDTAFLRRLRFIVQFPFPDAAHRAEIWRRIFPSGTPVEGLDLHKLARLNSTGGTIRNIALNAAFLAAEANEPVRMLHILRAARGEYAKLEKVPTEAEIRGWL
ncbi:MAG: ATP-binding protein [Deltaproteobacteria bacterium]